MSIRRNGFVLTIAALALSCGSPATQPMNGVDGGDAGLTSAESAAFEAGAGSASVNAAMESLADSLFAFDPTIDPKKTPGQNASAIGSNVRANLGKSCGKVTLKGVGVTVDFGTPPGCTLASGDTISGTVNVAVSLAGGTTTMNVTLTQVVFDGVALAGTASFATTSGSTFTVKTSLTSSARTDSADLEVTGAAGSFSISGTASVTNAGTSSAITFDGVTVTKGQCYATAGSLGIQQGSVTETLTFDASTPATGKVSVQVGKVMTTLTLPSYGSCPSGA
jgi:hypothetical protein